MKQYQEKWVKKLRKAWNSPNKNYILWKTINQILKDDTGHTDPLAIELAKWVNELQN